MNSSDFFTPSALSQGFSISKICRLYALLFFVSKDVIELVGLVEECFPNATFRVKVTSDQAKGHELLCHLAGRMRVHRVRILPGDRVKIEMTPYDLSKGRIVYRFLAQSAGPGAVPGAPSQPPPPPLPQAA